MRFARCVFGAAFATVISIAVRAPFCFYHLFIEESDAKITFADLKPDFSYIKELVRVAIPSAASQAFASLGFLVLQLAILSHGEEVATAFSLGNKVTNLLLMPIMSLGSVLSTFVGQNIGKGNPEWNCSAPHGAGRVMSRAAARNQLTMDEYKADVKAKIQKKHEKEADNHVEEQLIVELYSK